VAAEERRAIGHIVANLMTTIMICNSMICNTVLQPASGRCGCVGAGKLYCSKNGRFCYNARTVAKTVVDFICNIGQYRQD
jgi:hypothetical protein